MLITCRASMLSFVCNVRRRVVALVPSAALRSTQVMNTTMRPICRCRLLPSRAAARAFSECVGSVGTLKPRCVLGVGGLSDTSTPRASDMSDLGLPIATGSD